MNKISYHKTKADAKGSFSVSLVFAWRLMLKLLKLHLASTMPQLALSSNYAIQKMVSPRTGLCYLALTNILVTQKICHLDVKFEGKFQNLHN